MTASKKSGWGQRLRELREARGLARVAWTALLGGGKSAWFDYETEKSSPSFETVIRLKEITGCDLNWLATGVIEPATALDLDILRGVIQAIEEETPELNPQAKAKLISRLYSDRMKAHTIGIEAAPETKGRASKT